MTTHRKKRTTTTTTMNLAYSHVSPNRKCFSFYGSLFGLLLLLAISTQQASCRPSNEDDLLPPQINIDEEYGDVDNLEIHHVKIVDGGFQGDHPIIMYKEDFVDEDYVPSKNTTKRPRKYKDIMYRRRHKTTPSPDIETVEDYGDKTEKIYFDFLPDTPLTVSDNDDGGKRRKMHMKLVPLLDEMKEENHADDEATPSKDELQKRPKKYHRRVRRSAGQDEHVLHKRNPFFRHSAQNRADVQEHHVQTHYIYIKHAVPGKKHNGLDIPVTKAPNKNPDEPISFDNRIAADENDRVIFSGGSNRRPSATTRRPPEQSIFRDPRPENYDFSFMNNNQPRTTTAATPLFNRRPVTTRPPESIFRDPRPENFDFSFMKN
ncbi:hadley isoform X2 [Haematobia irritans]|uniref:hadley isoform X2 n=1 Tax=Haematobia irritans TaxID=7368 RepID=UPI003F50C7B4